MNGIISKLIIVTTTLLLVALAGCNPTPPADDSIYFVHSDHLNVPTVVTDKDKAIVWEGHRKPFGDTEVTVATIEQPFRFPGQYYDSETGLHYNLMRDYDPRLGRYVQSDPIGLGGGVSTYGYGGQNPIMAYDPTGEFFWLIPLGIAGGDILGATILTGLTLILAYQVDMAVSNVQSSSQSEQCNDECDNLNNEVQSAKNEVGKLGKCLAGMSKWELEVRRQAWLRLAQARSHRDSKCWAGGDDGHQEAQASAWQHVGTCTALLGGV